MNPGTILFIVVGIIGLLLYTLRALEVKENFISNQKELIAIHPKIASIFSALETPDLDSGNILFKKDLSASTKTELPTLNQESKPSTSPSVKPSATPKMSYEEIYQLNNQDGPTISDIQGSSLYNSEKPKKKKKAKKCPPMPDMSLYIRKDQIPCWNCVIP